MTLPLLALLLLFLFLTYHFLLHPLLLSPLSQIPSAHWSSPLSPLWILHLRRRGRPNATIHALHLKYGPLLRLGPNELSVNCVDGGIRTVYGGGYEKGDWYAVFRNYGVSNVFSSASRGEHSARKRMLSNVYAKTTLLGSGTLKAVERRVVGERLVPFLRGVMGRGEEVEMYSLFSGAAMDFVTGYIFGLKCGSDFLGDPERCHKWVMDYKARQEFIFWPQEMPGLVAWAKRLGCRHWLVPEWVDQANQNIEDWVMGLCDAAGGIFPERAGLKDGDRAVVYDQLRTMMKKGRGEGPDNALTTNERLEIASELLDHVAAGFDTTGITLTYLAWELSKPSNLEIQQLLRKELHEQQAPVDASEGGAILDLKELDNLPVLHAPRVTPPNAELGPSGNTVKGIPAGVRVNAQAYSLHLNEDVFPDPDKWEPRRWLTSEGGTDTGGEKSRWFWAFSSGGRMCIGSNLAMLEMKSIVAAIWGNFATSMADDRGMTHNDGYTSEPHGTPDGAYLRLRFAAVT
ncbi:cytochrome P450 monooxygenase [Elsinoe ampelina]|uniref:Cytochrome P450 monooxygenase n=1 Tax=Elsinoe ampelina TaxID=302913 RepID=A0A6A6G553_9PEZI|nr:cytochrome P450 monooxygenase [Elsinoe ampelina]